MSIASRCVSSPKCLLLRTGTMEASDISSLIRLALAMNPLPPLDQCKGYSKFPMKMNRHIKSTDSPASIGWAVKSAMRSPLRCLIGD